MTRKSEKYERFDAADYLDDLGDVAAYLEIALEASADDPTAVPRALGVIGTAPGTDVTALSMSPNAFLRGPALAVRTLS